MLFFSCTALKCISINNQECKVRLEMIIININESSIYSSSLKINKCSASCSNINDPYAKVCVPDFVKNMNVKVFSLVSRINETRYIKWHSTCKCKCRLDVSVCNNKQRWNEYKCRCECKKLIDKGICDKRFNWNPSHCECECDVREYLHYKNCKCRKRLYVKLFEECYENIYEKKLHPNKMIYNSTLNGYEKNI